MRFKVLIFALFIILCFSGPGYANGITDPMSDPFGYFNVYSLGNIGSSGSSYGSDFQGIGGAAGDVYFSSFSLHGMDSSTGFTLHTGGSATLAGSYYEGLEIGGDLYIGGLNIEGDVNVGGSVYQTGGGTVNGDIHAGGSINLGQTMTVNGEKLGGLTYDPIVDHNLVSDFFTSTSELIGSWTATGTVTNQWGNLIYTGVSGVNVIEVDADELKSAWGFTINAPADAVIYINVRNSTGSISLDCTNWYYNGGVSAGNVLLNMPVADTLSLTSSNNVNILAPFADTVFNYGLITGSLIVGSLEGSGQVNLGHFLGGGPAENENVPTPEPATMLLLGSGLIGLSGLGRKKRFFKKQ